MKLEFGDLTISGFKAFLTTQTLKFSDFPVGVHFIRGENNRVRRPESNGAAKSTIFDAGSWCLFGRTVEGLQNPDVVPWADPKASTTVEWELKIDGKECVISRGANPNNLLLNGEKTSQDEITRLLFSRGLFNHAVLLGQDQDLFFDLSASEKMNVFNDAMPQLERWLTYSDRTKNIVEDMESKKIELQHKAGGLTDTIGSLEIMVLQLTRDSGEWREIRKTEEAKIKQQMVDLKQELQVKQDLKDKAALAADSAGMEADASARELDQAHDKLREATRKFDKLAGEIKHLERTLKELGEADVCPTCGQDLKGTDLGKHKKELRKQIATGEKLVDNARQIMKLAEKARDEAQKYYTDFSRKAAAAQSALQLHTPDVAEMETELRVLNDELIKREDDHDPYREQLVNVKKMIRQHEEERTTIYIDLNTLAKRIARTEFWVKGFKEVRLFQIDELLQELQLVSNAMLADVGLEDWELSYAIEKETKSGTIQRGINVFIESPDSKRPVRWEGWSGGERQRLRIIGALALAEVLLGHAGITPNMIVLDEPTRNLSEEGVEDLCAFLAQRAKELGLRVWLIDHMANPSRFFASAVTVRKEKDGTAHIL